MMKLMMPVSMFIMRMIDYFGDDKDNDIYFKSMKIMFLMMMMMMMTYIIFVLFSPRAQFFAKFFSTQKRVNRDKTA